MTPFDILRRTPRNNCGQCGHPTCLAFAALVSRKVESARKCPFIDLHGLDDAEPPGPDLENLARERDLALVEHLKQKIAAKDLAAIAPALGAVTRPDNPDLLRFTYLGRKVQLDKTGILLDGLAPEDPRDQILLYNYVHSGGGRPPSGIWIGLESLPNSISKGKTLAIYCEDRLAALFSGMAGERILELCALLGGEAVRDTSASVAAVIPVLPMVPQQLLFWNAEPEDGFEARVKILFDQQVLDYLDLESLVFSAERMANRFADLIQ